MYIFIEQKISFRGLKVLLPSLSLLLQTVSRWRFFTTFVAGRIGVSALFRVSPTTSVAFSFLLFVLHGTCSRESRLDLTFGLGFQHVSCYCGLLLHARLLIFEISEQLILSRELFLSSSLFVQDGEVVAERGAVSVEDFEDDKLVNNERDIGDFGSRMMLPYSSMDYVFS